MRRRCSGRDRRRSSALIITSSSPTIAASQPSLRANIRSSGGGGDLRAGWVARAARIIGACAASMRRTCSGVSSRAPAVALALAEEQPAARAIAPLLEPVSPLLVPQPLEAGELNRLADVGAAGDVADESQSRGERLDRRGCQVLVAHQADRQIALVEPAGRVAAPVQQSLPKLQVLAPRSASEARRRLVQEGDRLVDGRAQWLATEGATSRGSRTIRMARRAPRGPASSGSPSGVGR